MGGGEALGATASPYIDSWKLGIKPFFTIMISVARNFHEQSLSAISGVIDNTSNFLGEGVDVVISENAGTSYDSRGGTREQLPR